MDLGQYIEILVASWTTLETSLSAIYRIRDFANNTPQESSSLTELTPASNWPAHGSVSFRDVNAGYSPSGSPVLQGIDLIIKPGEKIGVCGRTGSGKSSLVSILFGLLHVQSGQILIDDVPIDTVPLDSLRSAVVALPQESFFLRGSLRANLQSSDYASGSRVVDDEQMLSALQQVGLLNKLQDAADTLNLVSPLEVPIDNIDSLLSRGEQQLVCLVRAMLSEGKIVVIDEATSSVDRTTELLMQKIIRTAFWGRTVIAIAHRLSTIMDYDRVVVLERGRVVEVGEPGKLMVTDGSVFRALVDANRE